MGYTGSPYLWDILGFTVQPFGSGFDRFAPNNPGLRPGEVTPGELTPAVHHVSEKTGGQSVTGYKQMLN